MPKTKSSNRNKSLQSSSIPEIAIRNLPRCQRNPRPNLQSLKKTQTFKVDEIVESEDDLSTLVLLLILIFLVVNRTETLRPTKTTNVRQAVYSDSATETKSGGATPTYYGGYIFEYENDPAETAITDDTTIPVMRLHLHKTSYRYVWPVRIRQWQNHWQGSYCTEKEEASTRQGGLSGYLWCYDNPTLAPTRDDETSFLGTCAEENA